MDENIKGGDIAVEKKTEKVVYVVHSNQDKVWGFFAKDFDASSTKNEKHRWKREELEFERHPPGGWYR